MRKQQPEIEPLPTFANFKTIPKEVIYSAHEAGGEITPAGIESIHNYLWGLYDYARSYADNVREIWPDEYEENRSGDWPPHVPEELWDWWDNMMADAALGQARLYQLLDTFNETVRHGNFDRRWIVPKGDYAGTFPKRFASMMKKEYNEKVSPTILQEIGSRAKAHTTTEATRYLDFTNDLNWNDGDFGDGGSCYWGGREGARAAIAGEGGGAIRLWVEDNSWGENTYRGRGRCWYAPMSYQGNPYIVIWNAYGPSDMQLISYARIIATAMGVSYKRVGLSCNGDDCGLVYINGGAGYVIGKPEVVNALGHVELNWDLSEYDDNGRECRNCGHHVPEDNIMWYDDECYCEDCYSDLVTSCEICGRDVWREDAYSVQDTTYCHRCYDRHTEECEECNERFHNDDLDTITLDGGDEITVCNVCRDEYDYCDTCEVYYKNDHECPEEDDRPAKPMETIEVVCYRDKEEWNITLPKAYIKALGDSIYNCVTCDAWHISREGCRTYINDAYAELGRHLAEYFGHREERGDYVQFR